jgi:hypothetical protein
VKAIRPLSDGGASNALVIPDNEPGRTGDDAAAPSETTLSDGDALPWQMTVTESSERRRGGSPASRLVLQSEAGLSLIVNHRPAADQKPAEVSVVVEIAPMNFDVCPICLDDAPDTAEHVPPAKLGGQRMTLVCGKCNNVLGSRLEADFLDWRDGAARVRASADSVHGPRTIGRVLNRTAESGGFVLIASDTPDADLHAMLASGELTAEIQPPDYRRVRLAALKSAYLAACLNLGQIPTTPSAVGIRAELLAIRDAPKGHAVPPTPMAGALSLWRGYDGPQGPPLAVASVGSEGTRLAAVWLAGTVVVSWPLPDVSPLL